MAASEGKVAELLSAAEPEGVVAVEVSWLMLRRELAELKKRGGRGMGEVNKACTLVYRRCTCRQPVPTRMR